MSTSPFASKSSDSADRVGDLDLTSLTPEFDEDRHGGYYALLMRAIRDERHQNIALTGAYGAGKSSILQQLVKTWREKTVILSLSTITPDAHDQGVDEGNENARKNPRTQEIQKEIVKQLLYRLKPSAVPQTRFRRPDLPGRVSAVIIAVVTAAAISALAILLAFDLIQEHVTEWFPEPWRQALAYVTAIIILALALWLVVRFIRMRPKLSASLQSGAATVTLSKQEDSYFDAYLDEIVYFFQASRVSLVVIEDIDRFEDVLVFDTLRALNNILNGSRQVGRRIVFIYAIRDSVFEQIGTRSGRGGKKAQIGGEPTNTADQPDHARGALKRASRTKFFDVIIPVVPFLSADNARDMLSEVMANSKAELKPSLIRLTARHVADMRLMHNIRNEFEVYRERLVISDSRVPGIDDDLVFALVAYKNTHLADFEDIRHRESRLDLLFMFWRHLVHEELARRAKHVANLRRQQRRENSAAGRARRLGERLEAFRESLVTSMGDSPGTVELAGPATDENRAELKTWELIASGEDQKITLSTGYSSSEITLSFSASHLAEILDVRLVSKDWATGDADERERTIVREKKNIEFLRHHTWAELAEKEEFSANLSVLGPLLPTGMEANEPVTFAEAIDLLLESELARELIRHGYITSHFGVYSASYYGTHLGPAAREYIWRCIEPGVPDGTFPIDEDQVQQLLREQGADLNDEGDSASLFEDASVFNVSILDFLLIQRPTAAAVVARRLANMDDQEREFLDLYVSHGASPELLIKHLAPHWPGVLTYVANADLTTSDSRITMLDTGLASLASTHYGADDTLRILIEDNYRQLSAVSRSKTETMATNVFTVLKACGGQVASLADLNDKARAAAVKQSLYPITAENYQTIVGKGQIGLDLIKPHPDVYLYTLSHLDEYLTLVEENAASVVVGATQFVDVLNDAWDHVSLELLTRMIDLAPPTCLVDDLSAVDAATWPVLVERERTPATLHNVDEYIAEHGLDRTLGELLRRRKAISAWWDAPLENRAEIASAIVNSSEAISSPYTRTQLAKKIRPGMLDLDTIAPEQGKLLSYLIRDRLIPDEATSFARRLLVDWDTLKYAINVSKKFPEYVGPGIVTVAECTRMVRDPDIPNNVVRAILANLNGFLDGVAVLPARWLATAFADQRWRLSRAHIESFARAGVGGPVVMKLLHNSTNRLSNDEIKEILRNVGGTYAKVAARGAGRPSFPNDVAHEHVLGRLIGDTVRSVTPEKLKIWDWDGLVVRLIK